MRILVSTSFALVAAGIAEDAIANCAENSVCESVSAGAAVSAPTDSPFTEGNTYKCWRTEFDGALALSAAPDCETKAAPGFTRSAASCEDPSKAVPGKTGPFYKDLCDSCDSGEGLCVCAAGGDCADVTDEKVCLTRSTHQMLSVAEMTIVNNQCPENYIKGAMDWCSGQPWCTEVTPKAEAGRTAVHPYIQNMPVQCRMYSSDGPMMASQSTSYTSQDCGKEAPINYVTSSVENNDCMNEGSSTYSSDCMPCGSDGTGICLCKSGSCSAATDKRVCLYHASHHLLATADLDAIDAKCPNNLIHEARDLCKGQAPCDEVAVPSTAKVLPALKSQNILCRSYNGNLMLSQTSFTKALCAKSAPIPFVTAAIADGDASVTENGCTQNCADGTPGCYRTECVQCAGGGAYDICVCVDGACSQPTDKRVCLSSAKHFQMDQASIDITAAQCPAAKHKGMFDACKDKSPCDLVESPDGNIFTEVDGVGTYCGIEESKPGSGDPQKVLHLLPPSPSSGAIDFATCVTKGGYQNVPSTDFSATDTSCEKPACADADAPDDTKCYRDSCSLCSTGDPAVAGVCTCKAGLCKKETDERVCTTKKSWQDMCPDTWAERVGDITTAAFTNIVNDECAEQGLSVCEPCSTSGIRSTPVGGRCVHNTLLNKAVCLNTTYMMGNLGSVKGALMTQCPNMEGMSFHCESVETCSTTTYLEQECFCTKYDKNSLCSLEKSSTAMQQQCQAATRKNWWSGAMVVGLSLAMFFA